MIGVYTSAFVIFSSTLDAQNDDIDPYDLVEIGEMNIDLHLNG